MSKSRSKPRKKRLMVFDSPAKDEFYANADLLAVTYTDDMIHLHFAKKIRNGKQFYAQVVGEVTINAETFKEFIKHLNACSENLGRTDESQPEGRELEWSRYIV